MKELKAVNPATGKIIAFHRISTGKEIDGKVKSAKIAQEKWGKMPYEKRAACAKSFLANLTEGKERVARMISLEMGKPVDEALREVERAVENTQWFIDNVKQELEPENLSEDMLLVKEPVGTVAIISPFNFPLMIPLWSIIPALLAGNAVVFKPSEFTTGTGIEIYRLFRRAGLPSGCLDVVVGRPSCGKRLVKSDVGMICFVGAKKGGIDIMKNSAQKLHRIALELDGKNPLIVCKDADLKKAAKDCVAWVLQASGQTCASIGRVYVEKSAYQKFVDCVVGTVLAAHTIGPLTRRAQLTRIESLLADAKKKGAKILVGGKRGSGRGNFFEPTVVVDANHSMRIMNEETFGPVITIMKVKDADEAIRLSNSIECGLCAAVYSGDKSLAAKIAGKLRAGSVFINSMPKSHAAMPWGGIKQSGIGRLLGKLGVNEFLETKIIRN